MIRTILNFFLTLVYDGKGICIPGETYGKKLPQHLVVLIPGEIPTTDYYFRGRLECYKSKTVRYVDTLCNSPEQVKIETGSLVMIVRRAPRTWLSSLLRQQDKLAGVVFFLDDDIPAACLAKELPFGYAFKTAWRFASTRRLLSRLCGELWVSTPELQRRYSRFSPKVLEPQYIGDSFAKHSFIQTDASVYFYHGSWAHCCEIEWLVPIVRRVQNTLPYVWFEIIGTDKVKRLFQNIPRVRIVHPMPWKDYLASADLVQYQLGLAPCFDTHFNKARSHVKLFDITRLGAAGIYSNVLPYKEKIVEGETGMLCDNDQDQWVDKITLLLGNPELRNVLYQNARKWCLQTKSLSSVEEMFS